MRREKNKRKRCKKKEMKYNSTSREEKRDVKKGIIEKE